MKSNISKIVVVVVSIIIFSCKSDDTQVLPDSYPLQEISLYPEGIVYSDTTKKTYVGSYYKGKIITVDLDGNLSDFVINETINFYKK